MSDVLTQLFVNIIIAVAGVFVIAYGLDAYASWLKTHKRLTMTVRKLDDGRYRVRYYWSFWEDHKEYVTADKLPDFLNKLAMSLEGKN